MQKDISLSIEDYKNNVVDAVNSSEFPPAIIYYIIKDIFQNVEQNYLSYIQQAKREENKMLEQQQQEEQEEETVEVIED